MDHFFRNLDEFYLFEYSNRTLEIKQMKTIFSLLQRDSSFSKVKGILSNARALLIKTKDDSAFCGTSPVIVKSSPEEVVVLISDTVNLTCLIANSNEVDIAWIKNEMVVDGMNDEVLVLKKANRDTQGAYHCEVSNSRGRTLSNVTIVVVQEVPRVTEHPRDLRVLVGTETFSMACGNDGVPKPKTKWFLMRRRFEKVVRMNSSGRVFTVKKPQISRLGIFLL